MNASHLRGIILVFLAAQLLTGCGAFVFSTNQSPGGADEDNPVVTRAYASWTHRSCRTKSSCALELAASAGIHPDGQRGGALDNPKGRIPNPDPEWLPGWDRLPDDERGARDVFEALNLAASRKSWRAECRERYASVKGELDERLAKTHEKLDAARAIEDPHARLQALLTIPKRPDASSLGLDAFQDGFDAAAFVAESAIAEELRAQDELWLLTFEPVARSKNTRAVLAPRWSPADEEVAFCMRAAAAGHGDLPARRTSSGPSVERIRDFVRPLFSEDQQRRIEERRVARRREAEEALGYAQAKRPEGLRQLATSPSERIVRFTANPGGEAVIELHAQREYSRSIGELCTDGRNRIDACPTMKVTKDVRRTITFGSWPKDVALETGDRIAFFGVVDETRTTGSGTPVERVREDIRGLHLRSVQKKDGSEVRFLRTANF